MYDPYPIDDLLLLRRRKVKLPPSTLEYSISITASLAHYFIEQRRAVGLVTASQRSYKVIPAERSERQEAKILEALAFLQAESSLSHCPAWSPRRSDNCRRAAVPSSSRP
jgi:uncharacterized protein (DUF58 family)